MFSYKEYTIKNKDDLLKAFDTVEEKYTRNSTKIDLEDSLNLTRLSPPMANEDDLKEQAERSLARYKNESENKINAEKELKEKELQASISNINDSGETLKSNITENYDKVKQNAQNDAIKRGLARSSIIVNKLEAFDKDKLAELNTIDKEITSSINALNFEIEALETQKQTALNDFNISYASQLVEKISDLKSQLNEKQLEVIKYNNEVEQIEAEYEKKRIELNNNNISDEFDDSLELAEFVAKYGLPSLNAIKNNEKYELALSYLKSLTKEEREQVLQEDSKVKDALGNNFYNQLIYYLNN